MRIRFILPGDINTPTGGYRYDRAIVNEWRLKGHRVDLVSLPGSYPFPDTENKREALAIIAKAQPADVSIIDGLCGGAHPDLAKHICQAMPVVALIHHPLALENGLNDNQAASLEALEREGLRHTKAVVTTSPATSKTVHRFFDYPSDRIHTVLPGVERGEPVCFHTRQPLKILSVGSITKRKGHDLLLRALGQLKTLSWRLDIVGPQDFDPDFFQALQQITLEEEIAERVHFHGAVDEETLEGFYQSADIFALASRYEGYGMAYAEAIVRGLPVIATTAGAIPDTVPQVCGLLVPPDDVDALTEALDRILSDDTLRQKKHEGCLKAEPTFPTWQGSAMKFEALLRGLL